MADDVENKEFKEKFDRAVLCTGSKEKDWLSYFKTPVLIKSLVKLDIYPELKAGPYRDGFSIAFSNIQLT